MSIPKLQQGDARPYDWATEFDQWVEKKLLDGDYEALVQYEQMGTAGKLAVPTTDHYIPMLYTLGLADGKEAIKTVYESVEYGGLSMRTFQVGK